MPLNFTSHLKGDKVTLQQGKLNIGSKLKIRMCLQKLTQVELALAYKCENNLTRRDLLQYVHRNRNNNARRINTISIHCWYSLTFVSFLGPFIHHICRGPPQTLAMEQKCSCGAILLHMKFFRVMWNKIRIVIRENKLAKLRRHASRVYFAKILFR